MPESRNSAELVVEYVDRVEEVINHAKTIDKKKAFEGEQSDITTKPRKVYKKPCNEYKYLPSSSSSDSSSKTIKSRGDIDRSESEESDRIEWNTDMYITSQQIKNKAFIPKMSSHNLPNKQKFGGTQIKYYPSDYFKEKYLYPYPTYTSYLLNEPTEKPSQIPKELHRRELNCGSTFEPYLENQTEFPCSLKKSGCLKEDKYYIPQILKDKK